MRPTSVVRKPLALGNTATFFLCYGIGIAGFLTFIAPAAGEVIGLPFAFCFAAWAWSVRASDVVFDATGLTVVGRALERRYMRWEHIESSDVKDEGAALKVGSSPVNSFYLRVMTGSNIVLLAQGLGEDERDELKVIADCITEASKPTDSDAAVALPPGAASSLVCPNCGATVAPADQSVARCGSCGHDVSIPDEVQNLVRNTRALADDRREEERTLSKVLKQPGAREIVMLQAAFFASGVGSVAVWVTSVIPHYIGSLLFIASLVLLIIERRTMADRRAVLSIGRFFGAIAPARKGAPSTCRSCGAPLPVVEGTAVVACVFCNATNLLDVDLRGAAARASEVKGDLDTVLALRQQRAKQVLHLGVAAIVIAAVPLAIAALGR